MTRVSLGEVVPPALRLALTRVAISVLFAFLPALTGLAADEPADPLSKEDAGRLDRLVNELVAPDGPGMALVVFGRDGIRHQAYRGLANLEWGAPITGTARFYLGSLSKQFTAATVLSLRRDGALDLDQTVRSLVPELPTYAEAVTIRDLVHHTSGLRDYLKIRQMAGLSDEQPFDNDSVLRILERQKGLVFPPSTRYQYSNSNYVLLAEIAFRVTGIRLPELAQQRVFGPAGLEATGFESDPSRVMPSRVQSYATFPEQPTRRFVKLFSALGDGGAYSTPLDLARWCGILLRRDLFDPSFLAELLEPDKRVPQSTYAFGLHHRTYRGVAVIEHGGSMLGFEHWMSIFPQQGLGYLLLTNNKSLDTRSLREQLAGLLVGDDLQPKERVSPSVSGGAESAARSEPAAFEPLPDDLFGTYHNDEIPVDLTLSRDADEILVTPSTFRAVPARRTANLQLEAMGGFLRIDIDRSSGRPLLHVTLEGLGSFDFRRTGADPGARRPKGG